MNGSAFDTDDFVNTRPGVFSQFFTHVFSTTTEGKAEVFNLFQYVFMAVIPIFLLNKGIAAFIPGADDMKSTLEIIVEIVVQLAVMFGGILLIHRCITFFPTYSGYKYDPLVLTNSVLAFFVILFSIQSKISAKMNMLFFRAQEKWDPMAYEDMYTPPPSVTKSPPPIASHGGSGGGSSGFSSIMPEPVMPAFHVKPTSSAITF